MKKQEETKKSSRPLDADRREEGMEKYLMKTIVGILVAAGLLFAGYIAAKLANEDVDNMIKKTRWTQEIIGAH